jgi:epoxyqueuosine reductase
MWLVSRPWVTSRLSYLPGLPSFLQRRITPPPRLGVWTQQLVDVPTNLITVPGIHRDPQAEQRAYKAGPLPHFNLRYPLAFKAMQRGWWDCLLVVLGRMSRDNAKAELTARAVLHTPITEMAPAEITRAVRKLSADLGLSALGIAPYDPKYTFAEYDADCATVGDRVIIGVLEDNYAAIQSLPSPRGERGSLLCASEAVVLGTRLAAYIHELGFRAVVAGAEGKAVHIHYAVAAGLGQLGLNGQLLTPVAGSRVRFTWIQTNAPLVCDAPVDYGIPKICDACKVCVRRCPPGAITARRQMHRGVEKAKINMPRCLPTVAQAHGCNICTKVCPVQKYGLQAVTDEFVHSGRILGKDTDQLEGYDWIDGHHYGPGYRPRLDRDFFDKPEFNFDSPQAAEGRSLGRV